MKITKELIGEIIQIILGNIILTFGIGTFIVPANILAGGLTGLSIALKPILPIETEIFVTAATYILFVIGYLALGKKFAVTTFLSSLIFPPLLAYFIHLNQHAVVTNEILYSLYGGIISGIGCGLVFKAGSSTGGTDIPPLIMQKYLHIKINHAVIIVDGLIILLGYFTHGLHPMLVGLISMFAGSFALEKTMLLGTQSSLQVIIISNHNKEIEAELMSTLERGITRIKTEGAYHNVERNALMIVISAKQYPLLRKIVNHHDENAFITISDVKEVIGLGFSYHDA